MVVGAALWLDSNQMLTVGLVDQAAAEVVELVHHPVLVLLAPATHHPLPHRKVIMAGLEILQPVAAVAVVEAVLLQQVQTVKLVQAEFPVLAVMVRPQLCQAHL